MRTSARLALLLIVAALASSQEAGVLDVMRQELDRNLTALREKADPAPYFLGYTLTDHDSTVLSASLGALTAQTAGKTRRLDISIRVGSPKLDNYHRVRGEAPSFTSGGLVSTDALPGPLRRSLWLETDRAYRAAAERLIKIRTSTQVKAVEEDASDDFSQEEPSAHVEAVAAPRFAAAPWVARLRKLSARFQQHPAALTSHLTVTWQHEIKRQVTSEGTRIQHGRGFARLLISAQTKTMDGMDLSLSETFDAVIPGALPTDERILAAIDRLAADLESLPRAPEAEPFVGPAIFSGRAAGVFFHEIFGHRIEGHRQKDETEGQTFTKAVGTAILPTFLSVVFDPTRRQDAGTDLNGWYLYDDEGVKARPVTVVQNGVLKTFLMSRSPIRDFDRSNGHGRRQPGREVVARQSNLIVDSSRKVNEALLREMLQAEARRQNKPYGLYFREVTGGFTQTARGGVQAFKVIPVVVYRVFPDGRPDELVRGADIVGTPLASFAKILATSDRPQVFNGYCGAESGNVPVSAVSPSILVSEIEIEKKAKSQDRPPLLPLPAASGVQPILQTMREEMERARSLQVLSLDKPYHLEYALYDGQTFAASATLGGLVAQREERVRLPEVRVRVGDYRFDNTNYTGSGFPFGTRYDLGRFPLDDLALPTRRYFWLATDSSFKSALEAMARKRAALRNVTASDNLNDFAKIQPLRHVEQVEVAAPPAAAWTAMARSLSNVFAGYPGLRGSQVDVEAMLGTRYLVTSEGSEVRAADGAVTVRARASAQATDGMPLRDAAVFHALAVNGLPPEEEMRRSLASLAAGVTALTSAPKAEAYTGPVLFEGVAAPQLVAQLIGRNLAPVRRPVSEPGRPAGVRESELEGRVGARILPEWLDVIDDPTQPMFGRYDVDREGVAAKPLQVVERGVLKNLLLTRQPVRGFESSNGRARLPGPFGASLAAMSNLLVRASETVPLAELKKKLLETCATRGKPYGLVVRKLDFPSTASLEELRRLLAGSTVPVSPPVLVYRVYPDGREELVRGLRFRGLNARSLRDILAAGPDAVRFDFFNTAAPLAVMGSGGFAAQTTVVAPSLLIDDLELQAAEEVIPNLPVAPPPQ